MGDMDITVYGAMWCPDCRRSKVLLDRRKTAYEWVDVSQDAEGMRRVEELNGGNRSIPTIVFGDGSVLVEPSDAELSAKLRGR